MQRADRSRLSRERDLSQGPGDPARETIDGVNHVTFTGRVDRVAIAEYLSRADIGLCPDPKTPLNDLSTMNKTMEYTAYGLPSVSFDLVETRVSGADAVRYVPSGDVVAFADEVEQLIADPSTRVKMGRLARERVVSELDWRPQARGLCVGAGRRVGLLLGRVCGAIGQRGWPNRRAGAHICGSRRWRGVQPVPRREAAK